MAKYAPFIMIVCFLFIGNALQAQEVVEEEKQEKQLKNTIRFNLTNPLIFGKNSIVLGYERVLNPKQSVSLNVGSTQLPSLGILNIGDSTVQVGNSIKNRGIILTGDYRFYLASENRHMAPRGVYIGPYASYVSMGRENTWTLNTTNFNGDVVTDLNFAFASVGFQLGYQFVIWKRLAIDFVLVGPGMAFYEISAKLDTDLEAEDEALIFDRINEVLEEKFPGYTFAFDGSFKTSGRVKTTSIGYRYVVHLGFRF